MSRSETDAAAPGDRAPACPELDALEALLRPGAPPAPASIAAHLAACDRCRELLHEMRSANAFLARFTSGDGSPAADAEPEAPGARVIRVPGYEIEKLIAFGGQGAVYKARQKATGRDVAIKVPIGDTQRRPSTRYRFQREIELTARLDHPGIVHVFGDCELADGRIGCVMEFVEGIPIDRWAAVERDGGRPGVRRIVETMSAVADAIAYAHLRAVMHRDIKPSNVVVTTEGRPRVLDFGLAKSLNESGRSFSTLTGAFVGTLIFAAPEQISGGPDASDLRTDVYALGLLLFQALTGRLPHATDAPTVEILRHIREIPPPRPSSMSPDVGAELDAIVLKALAKEKDRRYASAAELRDDLQACLRGRAVRARFDSRWYIIRKVIRRHRLAVAGTSAGMLALAAMGSLGLAAREQANRARLADAVRDARTLESHRVKMSEARSVARDSFALGESSAWDALLEPEPVLTAAAIEGIGAAGPPPTSPAYWALWEIYARTPVVASLPMELSGQAIFADSPDRILSSDGRTFVWWDWRTSSAVRRLELPLGSDLSAFDYSGGPRRIAATTVPPEVELLLIDVDTGRWEPVARDSYYPILRNDRLAAVTLHQDKSRTVGLWDCALDPPRKFASFGFIAEKPRLGPLAVDGSGRFLAASELSGQIMLIDLETGRLLLNRLPTEQPLLTGIDSRGEPGEFIAFGPDGTLPVSVSPAGVVTIGQAIRKWGVLDNLRRFSPQPGGGKYAYITERNQIGIGNLERPATEGSPLPTLTAQAAGISPDGRFAVLRVAGAPRCEIIDLEPTAVRRLPFPSGRNRFGFATIFDIEFSQDGSSLYAGAMDGSLRRFSVLNDEAEIVAPRAAETGITSLAMCAGGILVGGHAMGGERAPLALIRPDAGPIALATSESRFSGVVAGDGAAWALDARAQLLRIDLHDARVERTADLIPYFTSPNCRALAQVRGGGPLIVWGWGGILLVDPTTLEPLGPLMPTPIVRSLAPSPTDPDLVAASGEDGLIRLWRITHGDPPSLELVRAFGSHAGPAFSLAFHPGGRIIASGGGAPEAKDIRFWDSQTGTELAALDLFEIGIFNMAFSPDGRWLAAGGEVRLDHPEEGGQLYLIDLHAPDLCLAGNLGYHIARLTREHGHEPSQAAALRKWAARIRSAPSGP